MPMRPLGLMNQAPTDPRFIEKIQSGYYVKTDIVSLSYPFYLFHGSIKVLGYKIFELFS